MRLEADVRKQAAAQNGHAELFTQSEQEVNQQEVMHSHAIPISNLLHLYPLGLKHTITCGGLEFSHIVSLSGGLRSCVELRSAVSSGGSLEGSRSGGSRFPSISVI